MAATKKTDPVTVYHPTLEDVSYEVPAADVEAWVESGWRKTKPSTDEG